jgi:hypothetical protein
MAAEIAAAEDPNPVLLRDDFFYSHPKHKLNFHCIQKSYAFLSSTISIVAATSLKLPLSFFSAAQIYVEFISIYSSETQFER